MKVTRSVFPLVSGSTQIVYTSGAISVDVILPSSDQQAAPYMSTHIPRNVVLQLEAVDALLTAVQAARVDMEYYARTGLIWNKEG